MSRARGGAGGRCTPTRPQGASPHRWSLLNGGTSDSGQEPVPGPRGGRVCRRERGLPREACGCALWVLLEDYIDFPAFPSGDADCLLSPAVSGRDPSPPRREDKTNPALPASHSEGSSLEPLPCYPEAAVSPVGLGEEGSMGWGCLPTGGGGGEDSLEAAEGKCPGQASGPGVRARHSAGPAEGDTLLWAVCLRLRALPPLPSVAGPARPSVCAPHSSSTGGWPGPRELSQAMTMPVTACPELAPCCRPELASWPWHWGPACAHLHWSTCEGQSRPEQGQSREAPAWGPQGPHTAGMCRPVRQPRGSPEET